MKYRQGRNRFLNTVHPPGKRDVTFCGNFPPGRKITYMVKSKDNV